MKPQPKAALGLLALVLLATGPARADDDSQVGESFRVPYRLTLTNHYLVRVRVDGKGPFNFLVDTGAPAVFVGTEAAKAAGIEADPAKFWTKLETLEIEGGAVLGDLNVRVEDPFQLVGMNALGLPGASIDGILGYTALARFRMEFDPTSDRMTWTRLDFKPRDPYVPKDPAERMATPQVQMMSLLGPAMKLASVFIGKQPEDVLDPQGLLGIELGAPMPGSDGAAGGLRIEAVLAGSPAEHSGVQAGDLLISLAGEPVASATEAHKAIAEIRPGDRVALELLRGDETIQVTLTASEGF